MPIYADADDFTSWAAADAPENIDRLLRSASLRVADATKTAVYDVNPAGLPIDVDIAAALRDATCAQAALWATLGNAPGLGGLDTVAALRAKRVGTLSKDYDTSVSSSVTAFEERRRIVAQLAEEARLILDQAGLLNGPIVSYG